MKNRPKLWVDPETMKATGRPAWWNPRRELTQEEKAEVKARRKSARAARKRNRR